MNKLSDNIIMSNAYCEITDCRDIENCEKCVELNIAEHDKQVRADEREKMISIVAKCIANNVYNVQEGINLMNDIKEQLKERKND